MNIRERAEKVLHPDATEMDKAAALVLTMGEGRLPEHTTLLNVLRDRADLAKAVQRMTGPEMRGRLIEFLRTWYDEEGGFVAGADAILALLQEQP